MPFYAVLIKSRLINRAKKEKKISNYNFVEELWIFLHENKIISRSLTERNANTWPKLRRPTHTHTHTQIMAAIVAVEEH